MPDNLFVSLWQVSLALALSSLIVMSLLIISRLLGGYGERKRDRTRQAIVRELYAVMDGAPADTERLAALTHNTRVCAQALLELSTLIRGDAFRSAIACLEAFGLERRLVRLSHSSHNAARQAAIDALGYIGGENATHRLRSIARRSGRTEDRIAAIRALQTRGVAVEPSLLTDTLRHSGNQLPGEFEAIFDNLVRSDPDALKALIAETELPLAALGQGLRSLGQSGHYESLPLLLDFARNPDPSIQAAALAALGELGHPAAAPVIAASLESASPEIRAEAARAAGLVSLANLSPELVALLVDPAWDVRINAARALASLGPGGLETLSTIAGAASTDRPARTARMLLAEMGVAG